MVFLVPVIVEAHNQTKVFCINHAFSTSFWLQSEDKQSFVPFFVWIKCGFKVDRSLFIASQSMVDSCFQKCLTRFNLTYLLNQ